MRDVCTYVEFFVVEGRAELAFVLDVCVVCVVVKSC
jgi:hypothetical protein